MEQRPLLIIADRIDTTRKHVAHAVASRNARFIQSEAKAQQQAGADFIGLKLTRKAIPSDETLFWLVEGVQQASDLPLCLSGAGRAAVLQVLPQLASPPMVSVAGLSDSEASEVLAALARFRAKAIVPFCPGGAFSTGGAMGREGAKAFLAQALRFGLAADDVFGWLSLETLSVNGQAARAFTVAAVIAGLKAVFMDPTDPRLSGLLNAALRVAGQVPHGKRRLERFQPERF